MFPASGKIPLVRAWEQVIETADTVKQQSVRLRDATRISRIEVLEYCNLLADSLQRLDQYSAVSGLVEYANNELNDPTINIVTEYATMRTQIVATQDWIVSNYPKDAIGNLVVYSFGSDKRYADVYLTTAQQEAFKARLVLLIATIN